MDLSTVLSADSRSPSAVPASLWNWLHGCWTLAWAFMTLIPMGVVELIDYWLHPDAQTFKKWSVWWSGVVLWGTGINVSVNNEGELDPDQAYVFVSNHQCALDPLVQTYGIQHPFVFLAKGGLRNVPMLGTVLRRSGCEFVDRRSPRHALKSIRDVSRTVEGGRSMMVYPEGGRTFSATTQRFRRGAFLIAREAGVPVVPVTIINAYQLMDERSLRSRPGTVSIHVGEPISVDTINSSDVTVLAEHVRGQIQQRLDKAHSTIMDAVSGEQTGSVVTEGSSTPGA